MEHPLSLGTSALGLHELRVASKLVKPKGKPGRKRKVVLEDIAEEDAADGGVPDPAGESARVSGGNMYFSVWKTSNGKC